MPTITGLVLAAGAGSRMGKPKALVIGADSRSWISIAAETLYAAGCSRVIVILGARADEAVKLLPDGVETVTARDWNEGISASIRAGLSAATGVAVLLTLVDLPGMPVTVGSRVLDQDVSPTSLRQAVYSGAPGHPVLIGRDHWHSLSHSIFGDHGARTYLKAHGVQKIECGDLWSGHDNDFAREIQRAKDAEDCSPR